MSADPALPSFAGAPFLADPALRRVVEAITDDGGEVRLVGGFVRDAVLGEPMDGDLDLATPLLPEVVSERARAAGLKVVPTGIDHGTVTVVANGRPFEVTTLRRDVATDGRRAEVAFGSDWLEDARRRDFTMNALSLAPDGTLHDPVGGYADCLARRVRFIGIADERIREDYLRILRFFRFHARFGTGAPDGEGLHAVTRNLSGLQQLSAERIAQEMRKLVQATGAAETLGFMAECGVLDRVLAGVPRLVRFARWLDLVRATDTALAPAPALVALSTFVPEDVERLAARLKLSGAERTRMVEAETARRAIAGLMASVGKPAGAEGGSADANLTDEQAREAGGGSGAADGHVARVLLYRLGPAAWRDGVLLAWADAGAAADDVRWRQLLSLPDRWTAPRFPLAGRDLMAAGLPAGPELGRRLADAEARWIASDFTLTKAELLAGG
ncbi:CCA tRNA nucleotidyltransferase [Pseudoxanthobacter sp. M-2]|uniref:CCA tRNA nucleotidyltransferase n=1 Tax=Pseudoxanthobacter sp. M-2 TaxID=3078754 RepID=UPI0038FD2099